MTTQLINGTVTAAEANDGAGITSNGRHHLWRSNLIPVQPGNTGVRVIVDYGDLLPAKGGTVVIKYRLSAVIEADAGNYVIHNQFGSTNNPGQHILLMQPGLFYLDEGVPIYAFVGDELASLEHRKQGTLSEDFRICIVIDEQGFGEPGAFQSASLNVRYELLD